MFAVGDKVLVQAHPPYAAEITRVGRPGTWYPGGATEIMVKPDDGRPAREVSSRDLTLIQCAPIGSPLCVACGEETDGFASLPTANGGRIHVRCSSCRGCRARLSSDDADPNPSGEWYFVVCVDGSFLRDPDDSTRDWEFSDARDAMDVAQDRREMYGDETPVSVMPYRREDGHAGILALFAALGWAVILFALWTVTGDAITSSACALVPLAGLRHDVMQGRYGARPQLSHTFGSTPEDVIRAAFDRETPDGFDLDVQGIDSATLDAIGRGSGVYSADQLITLLDELSDFPADLPPHERYGAEEIMDNAWSLRAAILETLGIEEI